MSVVRLSDIYSSNGSELRLPAQGSLVHSTFRRIDDRVTYSDNNIATALQVRHVPRTIGNDIIVEWQISAEADTNSGCYIFVNGNFMRGLPVEGVSLENQRNMFSDDYGYFIFNRDGNADTTPQTAVVFFHYKVKSLEPLRFDIYTDAGDIRLNRNWESANGSNSREINVSYAASYEFTSA
jgi:hypothetical protein